MPRSPFVEALRLSALLNAPTPPPDGPLAGADELTGLVDHQLERWRGLSLDRAALRATCRALSDACPWVFAFEIKKRVVSVHPKPKVTRALLDLDAKWGRGAFPHRALLYRVFLQAVVTRHGIDADLTLAVDMSDGQGVATDIPWFGFQARGDKAPVLLPDVDFFHWLWYARQRDSLTYEQKKIAACFVGSSTGGKVTERVVEELALPRLRSAAHFVGNPLVDFRIAAAVQCADDAARSLLERQPYFGEVMDWPEQFAYRFLISTDGNGAACSRLVIALLSQSVVIKYSSPCKLYYFPALVAGRDYIDVSTDEQVEDTVAMEQRTPGRFKPIAEAGQRFARRFLNQHSVVEYTARLLREYAKL